MTTPLSPQADALLQSALEHVLAHGIRDFSLRSMAKALGTSHRMLIYHFGSKEEFLQALLRRLRGSQQAWRPELAETGEGSAADPARDIMAAWDHFSADRQLPVYYLLFELYGAAVREPERYHDFLAEVIHSWLPQLEDWSLRLFPDDPARAKANARLLLAVMRGLLLDLITTGDHEAVTEALRLFVKAIDLERQKH